MVTYRLGIITTLALITNALDLFTFLLLARSGGISLEVNPVIIWAWTVGGPGLVIIVKGGAIILACVTLLLGAQRHLSVSTGFLCITIGVGVIGALSNLRPLL